MIIKYEELILENKKVSYLPHVDSVVEPHAQISVRSWPKGVM